MHLEKLTLTNFRSFDELTIPFRPDLTILVGENNSGKSNAIDGIRLLTQPLGGRRELYCETTDIRAGSAQDRFTLEAAYSGLSPAQQGRLLSATGDSGVTRAIFGLDYDNSRGRPSIWGGKFGFSPEPGAAESIRHVYLPPLRDAKRALASGNPTRIHTLIRHFLGDHAEADLTDALKRKAEHRILERVGGAVNQSLAALTGGVRAQVTELGFNDNERLLDIARDLRFKLADHGVVPEDLSRSGHGYASLLYMATIAVELQYVDKADLTLFLVEEPEAHLHPQLQSAVLTFLEEQAYNSRRSKRTGSEPAGELQVIVTTHSPNLSAWVSAKNLVLFRSVSPRLEKSPPSEPATQVPERTTRPITRCVPLEALSLGESDWRKVNRYLDVTKSALLFGGRVLLVEGVAEALLLPVIARELLKDDPEAYRRFRTSVFLAIEGVDFDPYVRLLLSQHDGARIADRVVVITDGDRKAIDEPVPAGKKRKHKLETLAANLGAPDRLEVFTNDVSLEPELLQSGNEQLLRATYLDLHKRSHGKWDEALLLEGIERALAVNSLFQSIRKGDFAQAMAERAITTNTPLKAPGYLRDAVRALIR